MVAPDVGKEERTGEDRMRWGREGGGEEQIHIYTSTKQSERGMREPERPHSQSCVSPGSRRVPVTSAQFCHLYLRSPLPEAG